MANDEKQVNEFERTMAGCYGLTVPYSDLCLFLQDVFMANRVAEQNDFERFAACIWGHAGIGKTEIVKQFKQIPVTWGKKKYAGYQVFDVPIAQFEEMGDLHGMPEERVLMFYKGKAEDSERQERWIPKTLISAYKEEGWHIDTMAGTRTMYAPPDWVPVKPGPAILLLDDWNRASIRIIKGIMQLLQNYGMVSWQLPPGCNIVLTGNPDEQDYLVTSIDNAILTRIKSVTLKEDAKEWAVWAEANGLDGRGITWVLHYPEMLLGSERTNPRTLAEFFRFLATVDDVQSNKGRLMMQAHSLLDPETVAAMLVFFEREIELVVRPEDILMGDKNALAHVKDLMTRKEKRHDILGIICERLYAHVVSPSTEPTDERVKNFQKFITMDEVPKDMRHSICRRIAKTQDKGKSRKWLRGNETLKDLILSTLR